MATIAYFVHGRGRGHAVRACAVVPALRAAGHTVRLYGGGASRDVLRSDPEFTPVEACLPGPKLLATFWRRLKADRARLSLGSPERPDLVVTDADLSSGYAARLQRLPALAMGHGLLFRHCRLPAGLPFWARQKEVLNAGSSSWACQQRVVVHFAPAAPKTRGTLLARPDLPENFGQPEALSPTQEPFVEPFVLTYFRDNNGDEILRLLVQLGHKVVNFGASELVLSGLEQRKTSVSDFQRHLVKCDFVVASAGNHLPAECALLQKPMLAVWKRGDAEHKMNARLLEDAGIGLSECLESLDEAALKRFEVWRSAPDRPVPKTRQMEPASAVVVRAVGALLQRC